jgi:adsorption protein B
MAEGLILLTLALGVIVREGLWLTALAIAINSLDDLAIDLMWPLALIGRRRLPPAPDVPGRLAVLVPAWNEAEVIGAMLTATLARLDHPDWCLFLGVYPNDPETLAQARGIDDPRLIIVVTSRPGPTTKADCLNHLWRAVLAEGTSSGRPFRGVVLHDAEDLVHPDELRLFDRALGGYDMVQIPVRPLVSEGGALVSGHYLDEFAGTHVRDMMVRSWMGAPVPSSGVGTAIRASALSHLDAGSGAPFDPDCLTEDYELGYRLHAAGMKTAMVRHRTANGLVCVKAYFPDTLAGAVRQKTRWLTGISLSGWDRLGWPGGLRAAWMLMRDRKGVPLAILALAGYALLLAGGLYMGLAGLLPGIPPLFASEGGTGLQALLAIAGLVLLWRLFLRLVVTWIAAGPWQALLALPRAPVANLFNALAALRALDRYRTSLEHGEPPPWDHTRHRFPDRVALGDG